jgi:MoxR-like ATPase
VARPVPLKLCLAASNEWPPPETTKELSALFDRFVFRRTVRPVLTRDGRSRLLWDRDHRPTLTTALSPAELDRASRAAAALPWTAEAREALETILRELAKEGVQPGDRRQVKAVGAARAAAWLAGADAVEPEHLEVLASVLWDDPAEQPAVCARVIAKVANPVGMRVSQLLLEVEQVLAGTDVKDLAQAATAAAKLGEVDRQLASLKGNGRLDRARAYVREQIKAIRLASLDAV